MEKDLRNNSDTYGWAKDTAQALRAGNLAAIDMDELVDHIESVASGLQRELVSTLKDAIEALLTLNYTTGDVKEARRQLVFAQGQLRLLVESTPSIQEAVPEAVDEAYQWAKDFVIEDFGINLPERCPFPLAKIREGGHQHLEVPVKLA